MNDRISFNGVVVSDSEIDSLVKEIPELHERVDIEFSDNITGVETIVITIATNVLSEFIIRLIDLVYKKFSKKTNKIIVKKGNKEFLIPDERENLIDKKD